jgi:hypothetical protein
MRVPHQLGNNATGDLAAVALCEHGGEKVTSAGWKQTLQGDVLALFAISNSHQQINRGPKSFTRTDPAGDFPMTAGPARARGGANPPLRALRRRSNSRLEIVGPRAGLQQNRPRPDAAGAIGARPQLFNNLFELIFPAQPFERERELSDLTSAALVDPHSGERFLQFDNF